MKKLGYLGPQGTFSEQAALMYAQKSDRWQPVQYASIFDVILAVQGGEVERAVVPFENSIEGTVTSTIDTLIFDVSLFICGEIVLHISQNLMCCKGERQENIVRIFSHPQGLAQCAHFLRKNYSKVPLQSVSSTAEAAKMVSEMHGCAAIAPRRASEVYNLDILNADIQDDKHNATRFVVLTRQKGELAEGHKKTSIAFSIANRPGELYRILDILNIWELNMIKIESRPSKNELGAYVFFVDIETDRADDLRDALKMMERKATMYKYLGTYDLFKE